jgi:hypothetical protein
LNCSLTFSIEYDVIKGKISHRVKSLNLVTIDMNSQAQISLPDDIIIAITTQLKRTSPTNGDLFSVLLVSKQWYQTTIPILYGNIALTGSTVGKFGNCFNAAKYNFHIRSLTLHIEADNETESTYVMVPDANTEPEIPLQERIVRIVKLLPGMQRLSSFSLTLEREEYRRVHRAVIVELIQELPETVTSLEIDTRGLDQREPHQNTHVCDALRKVFPRMQHLRIRLASMCCAMFGTSPDSQPVTKIQQPLLPTDWEPTAMPNLKSLIVSCSLPNGQLSQCCSKFAWRAEMVYPNQVALESLAWRSITFALASLVAARSTTPDDAQVCVTIVTKDGFSHWRMPTSFRIDMDKKESLAVPFMSLGYGAPSEVSWLVRLPNDIELIADTLSDIESLTESGRWRDIVGGARLPGPIIKAEKLGRPSWATGCEEKMAGVEDSKAWKMRNQTKMSMLWRDEEKVNVKLVGAEKRSGEAQYLNIRPVQEELPEGWTRLNNGNMLMRQ